MGQNRLNGVEAAPQVHVEQPLPGFRRNILKLLRPGDTGVIYQQVHRAQLPLNAADHFVHGPAVGHVGLVADDLAAFFPQPVSQGLGQVHALNAVDTYFIAAPGQGLGAGGADAPGGACNKGNTHCFLPQAIIIMRGWFSDSRQ